MRLFTSKRLLQTCKMQLFVNNRYLHVCKMPLFTNNRYLHACKMQLFANNRCLQVCKSLLLANNRILHVFKKAKTLLIGAFRRNLICQRLRITPSRDISRVAIERSRITETEIKRFFAIVSCNLGRAFDKIIHIESIHKCTLRSHILTGCRLLGTNPKVIDLFTFYRRQAIHVAHHLELARLVIRN